MHNYRFFSFFSSTGVSLNSPLLGKFCGNMTSDLISTPNTDVFAIFKTDHSIANQGFRLSYALKDCGGILTSPSGFISNNGNINNRDVCVWLISLPENVAVKLNFNSLNLPSSQNCSSASDYVQVQFGGLPDSPSIGKYCGSSSPGELTIQSNKVRITMVTSGNTGSSSFSASYSTLSDSCGGIYHSDQGSLSSPNYPRSYPDRAECRWDLNVAQGYTIKLAFQNPFDLEIHNNCNYDYVELNDIFQNGSMVRRNRYCNNTKPPDFVSTSNKMAVIFRSNFDTNGSGFNATWSRSCGGTYTDDTGIIYSPGYPNNHENFQLCNYVISPGAGKHIILTFEDFALEADNRRRCRYDSLTVRQGNSSSGRIINIFCGNTVPSPIVAQGSMFLQFKTDHSLTYRGFKARYYTNTCGGTFTGPTGEISTVGHGIANYNDLGNCSWNIEVSQNRIVMLKFTHFQLENHDSCIYDNVTLYDGPDQNSPLIGTYCGLNVPELIKTTSNKLFVQLLTDASVNLGGFRATYTETYGPAQGCGGVLRRPSGQISSPDVNGDGTYESNLDCDWLIYVGENKVVTLSVTRMDIPTVATYDQPCSSDSLTVFDGTSKSDVKLGTFCGSRIPNSIQASNNVLLVSFKSGNTSNGQGFRANFGEADKLCGGFFNATSEPQTITSPGYPNPLRRQVRCRWIIDSGARDKFVKIKFQNVNLRTTPNCRNEFVQVSDHNGGNNAQSFHYCGNTAPHPFSSTGQQVAITYNLPSSSSSSGFSLTYEISDCTSNVTGSHGHLTSPGYPNNYPHRLNCTTQITSPANTYLSLYFASFNVENHPSCRWDYLQINSSSQQVAKVCGTTLPPPVFLEDNKATLRFVTDNSASRRGYDITYVSSTQDRGCGGNITGLWEGAVTSPMYPDIYNVTSQTTCNWLIYPPVSSNGRITMTFSFQQTSDIQNCGSSYLKVYHGGSPSDMVVGNFFCNVSHLYL